ncbi:MAG: hypothetical protein ABF294_01820, partial [Flavobacteriales bacterium]
LNRLIIVDILPAFTKDNDINGLGRDLNCIHWCKEKPYLTFSFSIITSILSSFWFIIFDQGDFA